MLLGLNITVEIYRRTAGADDDIGGATRTNVLTYSNVKARIEPVMPTVQAREVGLETTRPLLGIIWPSTYTIYEDDVVIPKSGPFKDVNFRVAGVRHDSIVPVKNNSNAHIELDLVRTDSARSRV